MRDKRIQTPSRRNPEKKNLQTGAVDDLVVDDELAATVVDDEGTDGTTAVSEGIADALEEVALGDDGETLLDIAGLGHGDETVVITEVQDAVGLEDGAEHGLDNHGGRGIGDEAGLLLQLAGEEVDTEVTVLAGLGGDRDADHLARAALKDQDVADADEVAGDGDGLASGAAVAGLDDADVLTGSSDLTGVGLLMLGVGEGVQDTVGSALNAAAEGVVLAFVVVVTHFASGGGVTGSGLRDVYLGRGGVTSTGLNFTKVDVVFLVSRSETGRPGRTRRRRTGIGNRRRSLRVDDNDGRKRRRGRRKERYVDGSLSQ